jgi:hypothetical protein
MIALAGGAPAEAAVEPRPGVLSEQLTGLRPGAKPPGWIWVQTARA